MAVNQVVNGSDGVELAVGCTTTIRRVTYNFPFQPRTCMECNAHYQKPGALEKHHFAMHSDVNLKYKCDKCSNLFATHRAAACHYSKCRGVELIEHPFKCDLCNKRFKTNRGLGMHIHHEHKEEALRRRSLKPRTKLIDWSDEEDRILREFIANDDEEIYINIVHEDLPDKTERQIWERIDLIRQRNIDERTVVNDEGQRDEGLIREVINDDVLNIDVNEESTENYEEWADEIRTNWIRGEHTHPMAIELADKWSGNLVIDPSIIDEYIEKLVNETRRNKTIVGRKLCRPRRNNRASRKKKRYATAQELYKSCPARLCELIKKDRLETLTNNETIEPPKDELRRMYTELWSEPGVNQRQWNSPEKRVFMKGIKPRDIKMRIKKMKPGGAPGPDGVRREELKGILGLNDLLAGIFNLCLILNYYPKAWKKNCTSLIPKEGKNLVQPEGWRPITIGNTFARLFSGVLEGKLRDIITINERQKGFMEGNGCFTNVKILDFAIKMGKKDELCTGILDISKAFDCVAHSAIFGALREQGLQDWNVGFFETMYEGISTTLKNCDNAEILIKRGVKQGDPLSALLFNIVINPLLDEIERLEGPMMLNGISCPVIAFADDIVLMFKKSGHLQDGIDLVTRYLKSIGLALSPSKCGAFCIVGRGKSWICRNINVLLQGVRLRNFSSNEKFRYLGAYFTITEGATCSAAIEDMINACRRINKAALKPMQKLELLTRFMLPSFYHLLIGDLPSGNKLKMIDGSIRKMVKSFLHLPETITNGIIYCRKIDGGLGVPKLMDLVRIANLKAFLKQIKLEDSLFNRLYISAYEDGCRKMCESLGLQWPTTVENIERVKQKLRDMEQTAWASQICQGKHAKFYRNNKIGNRWLWRNDLYPGEEIDLLKIRTETFPVNAIIGRFDEDIASIRCRRCKSEDETLGHVIGECYAGTGARKKRHDDIVDIIQSRANDVGLVYAREQLFETDTEPLRPDLVIKSPGKAWVVDVTVRMENGDSLEKAFREKISTYKDIIESVKSSMKVKEVEVLPIVFGSTGGFPKRTEKNLALLGITSKITKISMMNGVLRSTVAIVRSHLDLVRT